jgi:hypothetical protein
VDDFTWCMINKISGGDEGFIPKFQWHGCIGEERKTCLNNMSMFPLGGSILLVSMWT